MKKLFQIFKKRNAYEPLVTVRISKDAILHNIEYFARQVPNAKLAPVLKSNGYGHGLIEVATILKNRTDIEFLVVDSLYEARVLRAEGITTKVLVLGYVRSDDILRASKEFESVSFTAISLEHLQEITKHVACSMKLHLKVDTGMHRQGLSIDELSQGLALIKKNKNLLLEGLCTHLSDADGDDPTFTRGQIALWNKARSVSDSVYGDIPYYHVSATKGFPFAKEINANVFRLGIGQHGVSPLKGENDLLPVLTLQTEIASVRTITPGDSVGYNNTFTAIKNMTIATVPVGYFEGVDRRLSNKGSMLVRGVDCPIIGRVSMNMCSIDVSHIPDVKAGERVIAISDNPQAKNCVANIATLCETIPYDILVHIPAHLRRVIQ
ncbi:MAG: alanine racemase [Candidatus Pacebacteria bacterium]|nr:alanine racemase [Candidatus Paceibacterota bacterium]